jgi:hypothetical protein
MSERKGLDFNGWRFKYKNDNKQYNNDDDDDDNNNNNNNNNNK